MSGYEYTLWIPLLPLLSFLIFGLFHRQLTNRLVGWGATVLMALSSLLSFACAYTYFFTAHGGGPYEAIVPINQTWLRFTEQLHFDMGILLDPISVMMLVVISLVSLMVHLYSIGYMRGEGGFNRYFAFLGLFSFSMYGLVLATNLFQMYFFWELVGVSSYLLIGYYFGKPAAVAASKKAFVVTRFADLGFLIGILIISYQTGTFDFLALTDPEGAVIGQEYGTAFLGLSVMTWALILVFIGGAGKSAMFPLHIWLPDAMEGPTPVSALIHAATMVVAGVYLVARLFPLYFFEAPTALEIVAITGAFTSLFAAIIACTQNDIKRILAYSTMSQLGYMMLALGVSGYEGEAGLGYLASMFHLFTHAMFKALLFLGAGAIIHAVHVNHIWKMGGLRKYMPVTHITFLVACLAIAGIPPFAGFFSKDEILVAAFHHNTLYFIIEYLVAGLTAFYMFRLYFGVFWNTPSEYTETPHEAPWTMAVPLIILGLGSIFAGFIPFHHLITATGSPVTTHFHGEIAFPAIGIALLGIAFAYLFYFKPSQWPTRIRLAMQQLYLWTYNKFYIDELYLFVTKKIIFNLIARPVAWFDRQVVDATVNLVGRSTRFGAESIKTIQSGQVQHYAALFVVSALMLAFLFIYLWNVW